MLKHGPFPGRKSRNALLGGQSSACRSRFERISEKVIHQDNGRVGQKCEASQVECNDQGDLFRQLNRPSSGLSGPSHESISSSSAADTMIRAAAPAHATSAPSNTVSWADARDVLMQTQPGWALERRDLRWTHHQHEKVNDERAR